MRAPGPQILNLMISAKTLPPNKIIFRAMGWRSWASAHYKDPSQEAAHKTFTVSHTLLYDHNYLAREISKWTLFLGNMHSARRERSITTEEAETRHERQQLSISGIAVRPCAFPPDHELLENEPV